MVKIAAWIGLLAAVGLSGCAEKAAHVSATPTVSDPGASVAAVSAPAVTGTVRVALPESSSVEGLTAWSHFVAWLGCGPCSSDGASDSVSVYDIDTKRRRVVAHLESAAGELGEVVGAGNEIMWAELGHSLRDGAMTSLWVLHRENLSTGKLDTVASCDDSQATPPTLTSSDSAFYWVSDCQAKAQTLFAVGVGGGGGSAIVGGLRFALPAAGGKDVVVAQSSHPDALPVPPSDIFEVGPHKNLIKLNRDGFDNTAPDVGDGAVAWSTEGPQGGDPVSITAENLLTKTRHTFDAGLWPHVGRGFLAYWPIGSGGLMVRSLSGGPAKNVLPVGWNSWVPAHFDATGGRLVFAATPSGSDTEGSSRGLTVFIDNVNVGAWP